MDTKYDPVLGKLRESDGAGSAAEAVDYTINGEQPDENGNFEVTAESIGAAASSHNHNISAVENLQAELDGKADTTHTHELVSGVVVGGETVSGELTLAASDNMTKRETASTHTKNDVTYLLTGEETYVCDFSALQAEGEYQIYIPGVGYSHKFRIGQAALGKAFWTHCRGLFHHRSGCSGVVKPHTNWEYPKPAHYWTWESKFICDDTTYDLCATPDGVTYPTLFANKHFSMIPNNTTGRLFRDLRGGWYDAADFDRRPYHFLCVRDLVEAYLRFPQNFTDGQLDLPESGNGIPDILSEAEWGLDVWRRGQREDGGVAAWIEANGHGSATPTRIRNITTVRATEALTSTTYGGWARSSSDSSTASTTPESPRVTFTSASPSRPRRSPQNAPAPNAPASSAKPAQNTTSASCSFASD